MPVLYSPRGRPSSAPALGGVCSAQKRRLPTPSLGPPVPLPAPRSLSSRCLHFAGSFPTFHGIPCKKCSLPSCCFGLLFIQCSRYIWHMEAIKVKMQSGPVPQSSQSANLPFPEGGPTGPRAARAHGTCTRRPISVESFCCVGFKICF